MRRSSSGEVGVGKSTTTVTLALVPSLAAEGASVGMLGADIDGPSQSMMTGISGRPKSDDGKTIAPIENDSVQVMSTGFPIEPTRR